MINLRILWGSDPITYRKKYGSMGIVSYADSNYTENPKDKMSIIRYYFFLGRGIVTQCSKQ